MGKGWESRRLGVGLNRHGHFLALFDQLGGRQNIVFGDVVQSTELVASTPLGFVATFIREGTAHGQCTQEGACQESGRNFCDFHELTPLMGFNGFMGVG